MIVKKLLFKFVGTSHITLIISMVVLPWIFLIFVYTATLRTLDTYQYSFSDAFYDVNNLLV